MLAGAAAWQGPCYSNPGILSIQSGVQPHQGHGIVDQGAPSFKDAAKGDCFDEK